MALTAAQVHGAGAYDLGTAVAGVAALLFAVGSVLQQEVASGAGTGTGVQLRQLVRSRAWLLGQAAAVGATGLQVVALGLAPVSIVQPVLAGGLVVALALRAIRDRCLPSPPEWLGAGCTAVGLAVFLVSARPAGNPQAHPGTAAVLGAALLAVLLVVGAGRLGPGSAGALASGTAAGVATGIAAVLISLALSVLGDAGLLRLLTSASLWTALLAAAAAQYGSQQAFARGSLSLSLPALTVVDPLAAVPAGRLLLGERLAPGHAAVWLPAAAVAAVGVVLLARHGEGCRRPLASRRAEEPAAGADRGSPV